MHMNILRPQCSRHRRHVAKTLFLKMRTKYRENKCQKELILKTNFFSDGQPHTPQYCTLLVMDALSSCRYVEISIKRYSNVINNIYI